MIGEGEVDGVGEDVAVGGVGVPAGRRVERAAIGAAHVLIHPSVAEGGANVIVEAVTAGTAVIASRISGNVGMLDIVMALEWVRDNVRPRS